MIKRSQLPEIKNLLENHSIKEVSVLMGFKYETLYHFCKKHDLKGRKRYASKYRGIHDLAGTMKARDLAAHYGVHVTRLRAACQSRNLSPKLNDADTFPLDDLQLAYRLVSEGMSVEEAALKLEIRYSYLRDWLTLGNAGVERKEITLQTQLTSTSCVSACLAMIICKPVEQVISDFDSLFNAAELEPETYLYDNSVLSKIGCRSGDIEQGFIYMLRVPSLNALGKFHCILLDTRFPDIKLYDPARNDRNKYTLDPSSPFYLTSWVNELQITVSPKLGLAIPLIGKW